VFGKRWRERHQEQPKPSLRCSFCNKSDRDVRKLIAGPTVFICDECVHVCVDILRNDARAEAGVAGPDAPSPPTSPWPAKIWCALCRMPLLPEEAILVADRGLVCRPCVSAVQATVLAASDASPRAEPES
jgi:hypothetical protein